MTLGWRMWLELKGNMGFPMFFSYHHPKQVSTHMCTIGRIGLWPTRFKCLSPHVYALSSFSPCPEGEAPYLTRNIGKKFCGTRVAQAAFGSFTQNVPASRLCPFSSLLGKLLGQVSPRQALQSHFNECFHFWLLGLSSTWFIPWRNPNSESWAVPSKTPIGPRTCQVDRHCPQGRSVPEISIVRKWQELASPQILGLKTSPNYICSTCFSLKKALSWYPTRAMHKAQCLNPMIFNPKDLFFKGLTSKCLTKSISLYLWLPSPSSFLSPNTIICMGTLNMIAGTFGG